MKKTLILILLAFCLWNISGGVVVAAVTTGADPSSGGLVTCGRTGSAQAQATDCGFSALVSMINTIIQYLIFIAMPLAAIAFCYAGWIYLSSGGDTGKVKKAKQIFINVGIGFALILSAWLIFQFIAKTFLSSTYSNSTYLQQ